MIKPKIFNLKNTKWSLLVVLFFISIMSILWGKEKKNSEVDSYQLSEVYTDSSVELQTINRPKHSFKFLFANAVKSPFSFNINLGKQPKTGIHSLWLYAAQADNHGQITVEYGGKTVGTVDNQLKEKVRFPILKLSYVGNLEIDGDNVMLRVTGSNDKLSHHYAELGLIVLAPKGMTNNEITSFLKKKPKTPDADFGTLLFILALAYALLIILAKEHDLNNDKTWLNNSLASIILLTIIAFTYFSDTGITPGPLSSRYINERKGLEQILDSGLRNGATAIKKLQGKILPLHQKNDDVPEHLQINKGLLETNIYQINQKAGFDKISTTIFSGKLKEIQAIPPNPFRSLSAKILMVILLLWLMDRFIRSWWSATLALGAISIFSILISIRLSDGWDEFFINLRHAYMLLNHGVYSINANNLIEATVDLIPLLLTTFLGIVGLELIDAFVIVSLLGNISVIVFSYLIVKKITQNRSFALIAAFLIGFYPNVLWVGASGFSAVLFCGWILASSYYLLFTNRRLLGLLLLSTLTLVRTEGILFAAILMAYIYIIKPLPNVIHRGRWNSVLQRAFVDGSIVATPFILSLFVRKIVFGHAIPNPISFKNTNFDSSYFVSGLEKFIKMISTHDLHLIIVGVILLSFANLLVVKNDHKQKNWRTNVKNLVALNLVVFLFILPYYIGGGDWFPPQWNRYALPFNLILLSTFLILLYGAFSFGLKRWISSVGLFVFSLALIIGYQKSAQFRQNNYIYSTLASAIHPNENGWHRIDNLSSLGFFLRAALPADAVVSSPEEATIMYFSKREMIGLLGISNPDMTLMPFQPMKPGDILHRKRSYATIFKDRPDVIALYEPVILGSYNNGSNLKEKIRQALQYGMFNDYMVNIAYYRVGSFKALQKMGYRHISISYSDRIFSLFIGERIYKEFIQNILSMGFENFGSVQIDYSVNPDLSKRYSPAVKEVMTTL